jgi:hypothetical protein
MGETPGENSDGSSFSGYQWVRALFISFFKIVFLTVIAQLRPYPNRPCHHHDRRSTISQITKAKKRGCYHHRRSRNKWWQKLCHAWMAHSKPGGLRNDIEAFFDKMTHAEKQNDRGVRQIILNFFWNRYMRTSLRGCTVAVSNFFSPVLLP